MHTACLKRDHVLRHKQKGNTVVKAIKGVVFAVFDENGEIQPESAKGMVHAKTQCLFSGYIAGDQKLSSAYKDWWNTGRYWLY